VITPSGRSAGDGYDSYSCLFQAFHRYKDVGRQATVIGEGIVNIRQDKAYVFLDRYGKPAKWLHKWILLLNYK
jgi:hypothetical protein